MGKEKKMITVKCPLIDNLHSEESLTDMLKEASATFKIKFPDIAWDLTNEELTDRIRFDLDRVHECDEYRYAITVSYMHTRIETYQERDARIEREARWERAAQEQKEREESFRQNAIEAEKKLLEKLKKKYESS